MAGKKEYLLRITEMSEKHGDVLFFKSGKLHHFKDGKKIREHLCFLRGETPPLAIDCRCGDTAYPCIHAYFLQEAFISEVTESLTDDKQLPEIVKGAKPGTYRVQSWPAGVHLLIPSLLINILSIK
jgi:hypothetical protein